MNTDSCNTKTDTCYPNCKNILHVQYICLVISKFSYRISLLSTTFAIKDLKKLGGFTELFLIFVFRCKWRFNFAVIG